MRFYSLAPRRLQKVLDVLVPSYRVIFQFFLEGNTLLKMYIMSQSLLSYLRIGTLLRPTPTYMADRDQHLI